MENENPVSPEDRKLMDEFRAAIDDPKTPEHKRAEYREELGGIANGYAHFDCLTDDEKRDYLEARTKTMKDETKHRNPPDYDQVMHLLGSIMETYSFRDFAPILHDPERLKDWLLKGNERAEECSPADSEQKAMEFMNELSPEERALLRTAFLELWGKEGKAMLPS